MTESDRDDRGVATLFLILAITVIFVGAGLAIDVGQYVVNARSAQNSADATALAVATDCALTGAPISDYSPYRKDGQTITTPTCGDGEASITVTKDVDGLFLPKTTGGAVQRSATAIWGTLGKATTSPSSSADCECGEASPSMPRRHHHLPADTKKQTGCASGPGGFGQLDGNDCDVECTVRMLGPGHELREPGNAVPRTSSRCIPYLPAELLIPIYDDEACPETGARATSSIRSSGSPSSG